MCAEVSLNGHGDPGIAEGSPGEAVERGYSRRHLVEQPFDADKAVPSAHVVKQVVQKLPFGARVALRLDGFQETLDASFAVGEAATLFRVGATRQHVVSQLRGGTGQNVAHDQRRQFPQ